MMRLYADLTDAELEAKFKDFREIYETVLSGGTIERVSGEGRFMVFTKVNSTEIMKLLSQIRCEMSTRGLVTEDTTGSAIGVVF